MTFTGEDNSGRNRRRRKAAFRVTSECPMCGGELILREDRKRAGTLVSCSNHPTCGFTEPFDTRYQEVLEHCHDLETRRKDEDTVFLLPPADAIEESLESMKPFKAPLNYCDKCLSFHDKDTPHARRPNTPIQERLAEPIDDAWFEEAYYGPPMTARQFLLACLAEGPMTTEAIFSEAYKHGFQPERLREVRRELGLITTRKSGTRTWMWSIPADDGKERE